MKDERRSRITSPSGKRDLTAQVSPTRTEQHALLGLLVPATFAVALLLLLIGSNSAGAVPGSSAITVRAFELNANGTQGAALSDYTFIVNLDNSPDRPGFDPMPSHSPTLAEGDQDSPTVTLPNNAAGERYLISIRSPDHKLWGQLVTLPQDAGNINISLRPMPLKLGKLVVHAFNDDHWTNGAQDEGEGDLSGFHVTLEDQIDGQVTVDYFNNPLCGGDCVTGPDGNVTIPNLGPATYFVYVTPPDGSDWTQTTTIDGGFPLLATVTENDDGLGAPGEAIWEGPGANTAWWFGFVHSSMDFSAPGSATITGTARNWMEWPPFTDTTFGDPVQNPYLALSDSSTDTTVYVGRGDSDGNFAIPNVPNGSYNLSIWDEQLSYIMRFATVTVTDGQVVDCNGQPGDCGDIGVSRWFGWLSGYVYEDTGIASDGTHLPAGSAGNGKRDCSDLNDWTTCEAGVPNFPMDQRWRDGSVKEDTVTTGAGSPNGPGYYEYPQAEGGALGKFIIGESGFTRLGTEPGASVHDEHNPNQVTHICASPPGASPAACDSSEGGGLLTNQLLSEGHRAWVDWGKRPYEDGETGQIVGITYFGTTRNEFYGDTATNEPYEAAIPGVEVRLEGPGADGKANTADDVVLNDYFTDRWQHPSQATDGQTCDLTGKDGNDLSADLNPYVAPNCLEVPLTGQETKDGAFDGGYAFADYCSEDTGGLNLGHFYSTGESVCRDGSDPAALDPGTYITHVVMPKAEAATYSADQPCNPSGDSSSSAPQHKKISGAFGNESGAEIDCLYRPEREEDVNVDLGAQFEPQIPPPPCTGDDHLIDQSTLTSRSPYSGVAGAHAPLCDKKLIVLHAKQNANADFFLMTNFENGPDVEVPGRVVGSVFDDIYFDRDPHSIWYGEPRPLANIPVGIYDYNFRLITTLHTDVNGSYEVMLPSTETFNCPIPQGPCPGTYIAVVDDPGTKAHPNAGYNPNYLTANTSFDIWPGQTDQLDTPIDPVSGTGCDLATGTPELLQVNRTAGVPTGTLPAGYQAADGPYIRASAAGTGVPTGYLDSTAASRRLTIQGVNFGNGVGTLTLTDQLGRALQTTKTFNSLNANPSVTAGGIVSWSDRQIVFQVPAQGITFLPGPWQLMIKGAGATGQTTPNGITVHVLGTVSLPLTQYNPRVRQAAGPTVGGHQLQDAIDSANAGDLLILGGIVNGKNAGGVYEENVILSKPVKLQGIGVGGTVGFVEPGGPPSEDPRVNIQGSVINGKFFRENEAAWTTKLNSLAFNGYGNPADVPGTSKADVSRGADITVVAASTGANAFGSGLAAGRIDGIGIELGQGTSGPGGLYVNAWGRNLQLTNNVFESDHGQIGGAIGLGTPYHGSQHNDGVLIKYDRIMGSGGITRGGGVAIFNGADNYEIANSTLCSNFSSEYGAGISHWGKSPNGSIHDNKIYYNDAFDSGAGISISEETPQPIDSIPWSDSRRGSGAVSVSRNVIEGNYSGDDGGGIFIQNALTARISLVNNMLVNNGAADLGGAIMIDDSTNVAIVNNTIANNAATGSSEGNDGLQHGGGLASESSDTGFINSGLPGANAFDFSNPVALFNNVFWQNESCTLDPSQTPPTLNGCSGELNDPASTYIDFEVHGTTGPRTFSTARYNLFTNGSIREPGPDGTYLQLPGSTTAPIIGFPTNPATNGNTIGVDPLFIAPFATQFGVGPARLDPQLASVTIIRFDPPVGIQGDYHLQTALVPNQLSGAVDRGVRCSNAAVPPPVNPIAACSGGAVEAPILLNADIDGQTRPQLRSLRTRTLWDRGADEVAP